MSGAMNRHCIPGLTMSNSPDGELSAGGLGIIKRCTQGLARTRIALCQRPGADTEETGRYDLAKDLCSVLNTSVNSNELIKV